MANIRKSADLLDKETALWAVVITLYGLGTRIIDHDQSGYNAAIAALQNVGICLLTAGALSILGPVIRFALGERQEERYILAIYQFAPGIALVASLVMLSAQLIPSLIFHYGEAVRSFFVPFIFISSTAVGVSSFYFYRNIVLVLGATRDIGTTLVDDSSLEHVLELKRTLITASYWLLGAFLIGVIVSIDKVEQILPDAQSSVWAWIWFFTGMGIILASAYSMVLIRMMTEYDLTRYYRVDERELLMRLRQMTDRQEGKRDRNT